MRIATPPHPDARRLSDFGLGRLPPGDADAVERHVRDCPQCAEALARVPDDTLLKIARAATPPPADTAATPLRPDRKLRATLPMVQIPLELVDHPRYRVIEQLGEGGMGVVYKAEHRLMDRLVALKVIRPQLTADAAAVERFRREVKAAARLAHPNIVTAFDAEQAGDLHFLVTEYVEGINLAKLVERRGPLPAGLACHLIRQAALGLQHAHECGMVHRDIKPHNLMVTRKGVVKILDFGLARLTAAPESQAATQGGGGVTAASLVVGTPDFLAPEQARDSRTVDIRGDLYSLGCTLYYLLTARVPFPEGSAVEKLFHHIERTPEPISRYRADVPDAVEAVVNQLMAKRAGDRFQTPGELAAALVPLAATVAVEAPSSAANPAVESVEKPRPKRRPIADRRRWLAAACLGVGLVALTAIVTVMAMADRRPSNSASTVSPAATGRVLFVVPHEQLWFPDYGPVRGELERGGLKVVTASSRPGPARCVPDSGEETVTVDRVLDGPVNAADYEAVIFAGYNVRDYIDTGRKSGQVVKRLIEDMKRANKPVASICGGQAVLLAHGVLANKPAAFSKYAVEQTHAKPGDWRYQPVVVAGPVITAADADAAAEFARSIVTAVRSRR